MIKTNISIDEVDICTPDAELLNVPIGIENVTCPHENCGRVVKSTSALRLHIQKSHGVPNVESQRKNKKLYACPVQACTWKYCPERTNYFKSMYLLKRHYLSVHGLKQFPCEKCSKKFGTEMSMIQHFHNCQKLFYCSCGKNYSTKPLLKTHLLRNNRADHKAIPNPQIENEPIKEPAIKVPMREPQVVKSKQILNSELQPVTVPCFLYIPKENTEQFKYDKTIQSRNQIQTETLHSEDNFINNLKTSKYVRILPKNAAVQEPFQFINPVQMSEYNQTMNNDLLQHITNFNNSSQAFLQALNSGQPSNSVETNLQTEVGKKKSKKKKKVKKLIIQSESRFEKKMKFVNSTETQAMLADDELMQSTLFELNDKKNKCQNAKSGKGKICRHFSPMESCTNGNQNLITNFTQTIDTSTQAAEFVHTGIQTNNDQFSMLEVMETSDFSSQCKLRGISTDTQGPPFQETAPINTETQTDDIDSWLSCLQSSSNINLSDMQTQTQTQQIDKSVQLDDILSGKTWDNGCGVYVQDMNTEVDQCIPSLFLSNDEYKQTISTQTIDDSEDISFEISGRNIADRDIVLPSQNVVETDGHSFGTQTIFNTNPTEDLDFVNQQETLSFGTQTGIEDNFFSSSGTQTWAIDNDTSINAKTIETQTAISFADLLDSSFIDEYLNGDRISSTETQTYDSIFENKELNTAQTQTF